MASRRFLFTIIVMIFSVLMSDELVLLARVSFAGTSMVAPVILVGILSKTQPGKELIFVSAVALVLFLISLTDLFPAVIGGLRMDLALHGFLAVSTLISIGARNLIKRDKSREKE